MKCADVGPKYAGDSQRSNKNIYKKGDYVVNRERGEGKLAEGTFSEGTLAEGKENGRVCDRKGEQYRGGGRRIEYGRES